MSVYCLYLTIQYLPLSLSILLVSNSAVSLFSLRFSILFHVAFPANTINLVCNQFKQILSRALHTLLGRSLQIFGASKAKLWPKCSLTCRMSSGIEELSCLDGQGYYAWFSNPGTVGTAAQKQGWSKIARRTTVETSVKQCCIFQHAAVIDRQPVQSL